MAEAYDRRRCMTWLASDRMVRTTPGPNPLGVAWSALRAGAARRPRPGGSAGVDHAALAPILVALRTGGMGALVDLRPALADYRSSLEQVVPDQLSATEALAYWLNLYNAGALDLAAEAAQTVATTVVGVRGGFRRSWATVAGETLSLDGIEHGKVRRLGDPRIHAALVCGSASCPTLRFEPYSGSGVHAQLDNQMRRFLAGGGAAADRNAGMLLLSRILKWYGGDFVHPHRMPTWLPATRRRIVVAITPWLDASVVSWIAETRPGVRFQPYDWALACTVG